MTPQASLSLRYGSNKNNNNIGDSGNRQPLLPPPHHTQIKFLKRNKIKGGSPVPMPPQRSTSINHHHHHHQGGGYYVGANDLFVGNGIISGGGGGSDRKRRIKCVLVGDQEVGKTSLAVSYSNDSFPSEYVPTAFDNYNVVVEVDGEPIRVEICDTAGEDELNPLRNLCYPGTDVFMLCFSVVQPASFQSAWTRWADELTRLGATVVLVGTQTDLRTNPAVVERLRRRGQVPVSQAHAADLAARLGAPYVETSAKTCNRLKEAFDQAILVALRCQRHQEALSIGAKKASFWRRLCCI